MRARRVEGVQIEREADEILAVKTATMEAHALNQSAAAVYELCDGNKTSKSEMAAEIRRRTSVSPLTRRLWTWRWPSWSMPGSWC